MTILIIIGCIIALFLILAAVMGKHMHIEKTITINKPRAEVFDYIRLMKNHDHFNVWMMMDPNMKTEFTGTDGQEGFVYAWDSAANKSAGAGEQETKKIVPNERIEYEIRFKRPMEDVAQATLQTKDAGPGQTLVQWSFDSNMKFPMNAMMPMFKNMLGKQLETSLENLRNIMER